MGQPEPGALAQQALQGLKAQSSRLVDDPTQTEACARHTARAQRLYTQTLEVSSRSEAMTVVSESLRESFVADRLYRCGALALATLTTTGSDLSSADPDRLGLAVATGWAAANAVPVNDPAAADAIFASAAASTLFGMPPESTEALYCAAARRGSKEAGLLLDIWPRTPSCRPGQAPARPQTEAAPPARQTVTVASATLIAPSAAATLKPTDPAPPPPVPARPLPPPPVRDASQLPPLVQPEPRTVAAPSAGLSDCRAFPRTYWASGSREVTVTDVFCRTQAGAFVQVSSEFTVN